MTALLIAILILIVISLAINAMILAAIGDVLAWSRQRSGPRLDNSDLRQILAMATEAAREATKESESRIPWPARIPRYDA
ncbi:MAG TPA: hypothetical protein VK638_44815 [Edaphobacter sp.]|nr:hypothetical protein [Edaphobacter sp.]